MATDSAGTGAGPRPARRHRHIARPAGDQSIGAVLSRPSRASSRPRLALRVAGAGLLAATAAIHLDLYLTGYRTIPTIGWLFLLQVITGFGLAAALLTSGRRIVAAAGAGFAVATLGGYLLSVWAGLFGFTEVRTTAGIAAGVIEVAAFAVLAVAAAVPVARSPAAGPARPRRPLASLPTAVAAAAGVSVLALALLGAAAMQAGSPQPAAASKTAVELKTTTIGGATVLANAKGLTLYWFAPDTPARSACYGSCAAYWPPVTGKPAANPGLTGHLGTLQRSDGQLQATYNGHPLYTYVGDSAPGQARGNNLNLNGGLWHEITVSG